MLTGGLTERLSGSTGTAYRWGLCRGRVLFARCAQEHHAQQPVELRHAFLGGKPRYLGERRRGVRRFQTRRQATVLYGAAEGATAASCCAGCRRAGNNAHFYRVLKAAQYPKAEAQSFLLVSHATHDRRRPSREFRQFVEVVRREPEIVRVLFTTQPRADKIHDFESLVHAPVGHPVMRGDALLEFQKGTWKVTKHAIAIVAQPGQQNGPTGQPAMALENDLRIKPPIKTVGHGKPEAREPSKQDE